MAPRVRVLGPHPRQYVEIARLINGADSWEETRGTSGPRRRLSHLWEETQIDGSASRERHTHRGTPDPAGSVYLIPEPLTRDGKFKDESGWVSQSCIRNTRRCEKSVSVKKNFLASRESPVHPVTQHEARGGQESRGRGLGRCGRGFVFGDCSSLKPGAAAVISLQLPRPSSSCLQPRPDFPPRAQLLCLPPTHTACLHQPLAYAPAFQAYSRLYRLPVPLMFSRDPLRPPGYDSPPDPQSVIPTHCQLVTSHRGRCCNIFFLSLSLSLSLSLYDVLKFCLCVA